MNKIARTLVEAVILAGVATVAYAQQRSQLPDGYPSRPVRVIVPNAPGGGIDIVARLVSHNLTERLGRPFVVDNRGGAAGTIAMELGAQATPDGYTLLVGTGTTMTTATLLKKVDFDTRTAYAPIVEMVSQPYLLTVAPTLPVNSVKELIAYAKSKPGALNYGTTGIGSGSHLGMERFKFASGVDIVHVPYKGLAPAMVDVIGGQIQVMLGAAITLTPFVKSAKLKALAVGSLRRSQTYPDLPTISEAGLAGFEQSNTYALYAPAATPSTILLTLNREIGSIVNSPDIRAKLADSGAEPVAPHTPAEFKAKYAKEVDVWQKFFSTTRMKL